MKKILILVFLLISLMGFGQIQTINVGVTPNDHSGDPLRTAFIKVNANFVYHTSQIGLKLGIADLDYATSNIQQQLNDTLQGKTLYVELADTGMVSIAFGYGSGAAADTTGLNMLSDFGGFFNDGSDTIIVTKVIGIVKDSKNASNAWINVYYGTTYYTAVDSVLTATLSITSTTTGTSSTTFHSKKIPPANWVWCKPGKSFGTTGTIPSKLRVTLSGYKIPKY